ncbi:hypothetical protein FJO69_02850 [[Mycoplasma] falconis]|uniref:Uncharacterized protein n=1 Tax=[Mycoplasma] falconis TaxID=92403 RepID=A0A501X7S7_9BACT|nr:hypothetical protein [[Mycoplasma] falconis]TPE56571.1 hypothetical protein FJO69_02850 [[Mycoplasma] falconis]
MTKKQKILISTLVPTFVVATTAVIAAPFIAIEVSRNNEIKRAEFLINNPHLLENKDENKNRIATPIKLVKLTTSSNDLKDIEKEFLEILNSDEYKPIEGYNRIVLQSINNFDNLNQESLKSEFFTNFKNEKQILFVYLPNKVDDFHFFDPELKSEFIKNEKELFFTPYQEISYFKIPINKNKQNNHLIYDYPTGTITKDKEFGKYFNFGLQVGENKFLEVQFDIETNSWRENKFLMLINFFKIEDNRPVEFNRKIASRAFEYSFK